MDGATIGKAYRSSGSSSLVGGARMRTKPAPPLPPLGKRFCRRPSRAGHRRDEGEWGEGRRGGEDRGMRGTLGEGGGESPASAQSSVSSDSGPALSESSLKDLHRKENVRQTAVQTYISCLSLLLIYESNKSTTNCSLQIWKFICIFAETLISSVASQDY